MKQLDQSKKRISKENPNEGRPLACGKSTVSKEDVMGLGYGSV